MTHQLPGLLSVNTRTARPVIRMLTRAFMNYPLLTHFYPEENARRRLADNMMAMPVYTCLRYGEVYTTSDNLEGAAVWTPSEYYPLGFWKVLRSVPLRYLLGAAGSGAARMNAIDKYLNNVHRRLAPYPHYYLEILGVDPAHQKKGFSSRLLRPMLDRLAGQRLACYLETQDPLDVPVYQHFGFEVVEESEIPGTPLGSWAMLRKP